MATQQIQCPNCAAPITLDSRLGRRVQCEYCGSEIVLDADVFKGILEEKEAQVKLAARELELKEAQARQANREKQFRKTQEEVSVLKEKEEKKFRSWKKQWYILLTAAALLTFVNFLIPDTSSLHETVNTIWGFIFLGAPLYSAIRRPVFSQIRPKSTFLKGSRLSCYIKMTLIKWGICIAAAGLADIF